MSDQHNPPGTGTSGTGGPAEPDFAALAAEAGLSMGLPPAEDIPTDPAELAALMNEIDDEHMTRLHALLVDRHGRADGARLWEEALRVIDAESELTGALAVYTAALDTVAKGADRAFTAFGRLSPLHGEYGDGTNTDDTLHLLDGIARAVRALRRIHADATR
ncbi:hypothetical protein [Saccharothrix sp. HUAS TT1]|uniref:hypothetical protein n=1 Tax=unclassified Saccharothrix TaxID=2593673 RepID=UPI00345BEFDC